MAHFGSSSPLSQIRRLTNPLFTPQGDLKSPVISVNESYSSVIKVGVLNKALKMICGHERTRITLEFSFSISKTCAAHHLAIFPLTIPLLSNLVVHTIIMAPFCGVGQTRGKELSACSDSQGSALGHGHGILKAGYLEGVARKVEGHDLHDRPLFGWI